MATTAERIKKLFLDNFGFPEERLHLDATIESVGLDSLDKIEFMFVLEEEFAIKIPDRAVTLNSIRDIVDVVDMLVAKQEQGVCK